MNQLKPENQYLIFKVEDFCTRLKNNEYKHPVDVAKTLSSLADLAWDEVEDLYPPSIRIDP